MDTAEDHRNLVDPAWRRWLLLSALVLISALYVAAFGLFVTRSRDFIVARFNERALDFSRAHMVSVPARLSFGLGEHDNARLGGGWHAPDAGGVWSQTLDAFVEIVVSTRQRDLLLRINTTALVAKQRPKMRIKVFINGMRAGTWVRSISDASEPIDIPVPASLTGTGQLEIHLKLDHVASPLRLSGGPDDRQLGVLLHSIDVSEMAGAAPSP